MKKKALQDKTSTYKNSYHRRKAKGKKSRPIISTYKNYLHREEARGKKARHITGFDIEGLGTEEGLKKRKETKASRK